MAYRDFVGEIIVDFPSSKFEISDFATDVGINTDGLTIIGFELNAGGNHPGRPKNKPTEIKVTLLAVKNSVWDNKFKTFGEYWKQEKELQVVMLKTDMTLHDFHAKHLKRFQGQLLLPQLKNKELIFELQE